VCLPIGAIFDIINRAQAGVGNFAKSAAPVAASLSKSARAQRKLVQADTEKLKRGKLGLTEAQKRQRLANAMRAARAQIASQNVALQRQQAMAGGRSGSPAAQQRSLADTEAAVAALASQNIEQQSQNQAARRRAEILQRIRMQQQINRQNWMDATKNIGSTGKQRGGVDYNQLESLYGGNSESALNARKG